MCFEAHLFYFVPLHWLAPLGSSTHSFIFCFVFFRMWQRNPVFETKNTHTTEWIVWSGGWYHCIAIFSYAMRIDSSGSMRLKQKNSNRVFGTSVYTMRVWFERKGIKIKKEESSFSELLASKNVCSHFAFISYISLSLISSFFPCFTWLPLGHSPNSFASIFISDE